MGFADAMLMGVCKQSVFEDAVHGNIRWDVSSRVCKNWYGHSEGHANKSNYVECEGCNAD